MQVSQRYSVELLEDPLEREVEELAALLGLQRVSQSSSVAADPFSFESPSPPTPQTGWIFTDLEPEANGKVAYKRSIVSNPSHTSTLNALGLQKLVHKCLLLFSLS